LVALRLVTRLSVAISPAGPRLKEVDGFQRITPAPGKPNADSMTLTPDRLALWKIGMKRRAERRHSRTVTRPHPGDVLAALLVVAR